MVDGRTCTPTWNVDLANLELERLRLVDVVERQQSHLEAIVENLPGLVWESWGTPDKNDLRVDYLNDYVEGVLGYTREEWIDRPQFWLEIIEANDRLMALSDLNGIYTSGEKGTHQFRWVAKDGSTRWMELHVNPVRSDSGDVVGACGITLDITERKDAEIALQSSLRLLSRSVDSRSRMHKQAHDLTERLTRAQDDERRRISRELHDNVGQKLAMIGMAIDEVKTHSSETPHTEVNLAKLSENVAELSLEIDNLAHELHPTLLELATALRSFCVEFGRIHRVNVSVDIRHIGSIDDEVTLCIYRVVQEALHNVAKHANSSSAQVILDGRKKNIVLIISDAGIGFETSKAASKAGLGLVGIKERVLLLRTCPAIIES